MFSLEELKPNEANRELMDSRDNTKREKQNKSFDTTPNEKTLTLPKFEDGLVGLRNNTFYCYMNACL